MPVIFASSYAGAMNLVGGNPVTSGSGFDATYSDAAVDTAGAAPVVQLQTPSFPAPLDEGWAHVYMAIGSSAYYKTGWFFGFWNTIRNDYDVGIWITNVSNVDHVECYYWNGTAMVSGGAAVPMASSGSFYYDLYFKKDASDGRIALYKNEALLWSASGLNTSNVAPNAVRWKAGGSHTADARLTQFLVADESTVGARVFTPNISAGAVNTLLAGGASDLSVDAVRLPNTFVTADTNGQLATFACEDFSTSMEVMGVAVNTRTKKGSTGPANLELLARVGGVNYSSDTFPLSLGVEAISYVFNFNPATGLAWTPTQVNDAEFGLKAVT